MKNIFFPKSVILSRKMKSQNTRQSNKMLNPFEDDLFKLIEKINFKN